MTSKPSQAVPVTAPLPVLTCDWPECVQAAVVFLERKHNLCRVHYVAYFQTRKIPTTREPGSDDE